MDSTEDGWVELQVAEAKSCDEVENDVMDELGIDIGETFEFNINGVHDEMRGKIRLNNDAMGELGIDIGETVEIKGLKTTAAVAWPSYPEDANRSIIRMDNIIRKNADISLQETVQIRKAKVKDAKMVILKCRETHLPMGGRGYNRFAKRKLCGHVLIKNDIVMLHVTDTLIPFVAVYVKPDSIVRLGQNTEIKTI